MSPELPTEITDVLHSTPGMLRVVDPTTQRVYVIIDDETHRQAMRALQQQQDWEAIQEGIAQADRGETMSLEEVDAKIRSEFGFPASS